MIVLIDNYDSFTYNLYQSMAAIEPKLRVIRNDQATVDEIESWQPTAIVISPGPGRPEQAGIGIELVKRLGGQQPILGICLGHQIITVAYGGQVVLAKEPVHGKSTTVFHHQHALYQEIPSPFTAARYHSLVVNREDLPHDLVVNAENEDGLVMGIHHNRYPVYGLQFHPESILTPMGHQLMRNFLKAAIPGEHLSH